MLNDFYQMIKDEKNAYLRGFMKNFSKRAFFLFSDFPNNDWLLKEQINICKESRKNNHYDDERFKKFIFIITSLFILFITAKILK